MDLATILVSYHAIIGSASVGSQNDSAIGQNKTGNGRGGGSQRTCRWSVCGMILVVSLLLLMRQQGCCEGETESIDKP
jgi:hypothetical protein